MKEIIIYFLIFQIIKSAPKNYEEDLIRHLDYVNDSDPEIDSCLIHNETIDVALYNNSEDTCTQHILGDINYRCCYISYRVGKDYTNQFCKIIAFNANAINDVKKSFSHAKDVNILCFHSFLKVNFTFLGFITFFFIIF